MLFRETFLRMNYGFCYKMFVSSQKDGCGYNTTHFSRHYAMLKCKLSRNADRTRWTSMFSNINRLRLHPAFYRVTGRQ
jgi:hypothetical protein